MDTARRYLSPVVGAFAGGLSVALLEAIGHLVYPPPPGTDLADPAALETIMMNAPTGALVAVLVASFCGVVVAMVAARAVHPDHAMWPEVVAALLLAAGAVATVVVIPHPMWFLVATALVYLAAAAVGSRVRPRAWAPAADH